MQSLHGAYDCRAMTAEQPIGESVETLSGWGLAKASRSRVTHVAREEGLPSLLAAPAGGVIARGCGRSYGDAAQLDGGRVLDMKPLCSVLSFDGRAGTLDAQAGATLRQLQHMLVGAGWSLPVLPGTQDVTLGGAIAADVHGKGHEQDGSFSRHLAGIRLVLPGGETVDLDSPEDDVWRATAGGMGLTGVIASATVRLRRITGSLMSVNTERTASLDDTLAALADDRTDRRYSVAWIDVLVGGPRRGRGIVTKGEHADVPGSVPGYGRRRGLSVPRRVLPSLLRPEAVRAFNELNWRHAPRRRCDELIDMERFFFPLDSARDWNRLYGAAGFFQYQFVVPPDRADVLDRSLELLARQRVPVYLAILKRFGLGDPGFLSFPMPGWTLALDLPAAAQAARGAMDKLDEIVVAAGGRVYLAKDARMRAEHLAAMYPQLGDWLEVRARCDPERVMRSDLSDRIGLTGRQR